MKRVLICIIAASAVVSSCLKADYSISGEMAPNMQAYTADAVFIEPDPQQGDQFDKITENDYIKTADEATSTFSVDADGASYAYMRRCIRGRNLPDANSVRIEEFLNYFTFNYDDPAGDEMLAINAELGDCPWKAGHKLLRLGLKGKSLQEQDIPAANFILLVDVSGSMSGDDRIELLKKGLIKMVEQMRPEDRIAIITYSGSVKKILESTLVKDSKSIIKAIKKLEASGSTAGGAAMKMAYEEAKEHYISGGNNRIIMCTDGDFNVGVSDTDALVEMVESYLDKGIYLSIMGFGTGNYMDGRMESLSNHGNGTYTYIDCEEEMMKVFVHERSRMYAVANDTKCQITFNPEAVESYRLIGYENRVMNNEDFEDDSKDAGEIGAGQTVTALYEIIPAQGYDAAVNFAKYDVRYKFALGGESRPLSLDIAVPSSGAWVSDEFNFAAGCAAFGLCLRNSQYKGDASYKMAGDLIKGTLNHDPNGLRSQLVQLIETAREID